MDFLLLVSQGKRPNKIHKESAKKATAKTKHQNVWLLSSGRGFLDKLALDDEVSRMNCVSVSQKNLRRL